MDNYCKDCRFYENHNCLERNCFRNAQDLACSRFSMYSTRNHEDLEYCRDCRFYSGNHCEERNTFRNGNDYKCSHGSVCR